VIEKAPGQLGTAPAPTTLPTDAQSTAQPPASAPAPPANTVTVPPQTSEPPATGGATAGGATAGGATAGGATAGGATASTLPGRHKRHKNPVTANTDQNTSTSQTGPVTTGVEPSTASCDADGDGVVDPGAPVTCTTVTTAVQESVTIAPATAVPAPETKAPAKKKVKRRRASTQSPSAAG
jgi:hypothetical protein